ncbi:MAG: penicillin-binding protein activator [Hyphomicrobium sp.]|nr:penicillin-binding protein activator [Hyphomicrobium sp.]
MGTAEPPTAALAPAPGQSQGQIRAPVKIALLLPLGGMGETAAIAKGMKQGAEMALFELNDPNVELITKDDGGTAAGARAAADAAIKEGAEIIVGPLLSQSVTGVAPVARQANVPVLAFSNNSQVAGQGIYLLSFLAEQEAERIVSFAAAQGKRRFAALIPDDAYGAVVEAAFRQAVQRNGGSVAVVERYPLAANGMLAPAKARRRGDQDRRGADGSDRRAVPAGWAGGPAANRPGHRLFRPRHDEGEAARHQRLGLPSHRA